MNMRTQTAHDLATALLGRRRHDQSVKVIKSRYGGYSIFGRAEPRHVVMVDGQFFDVRSRTLRLLQSGEFCPDELDLDPMTNDEVEKWGEE